MSSLKYVPSFDGVRCIAVTLVLLIHGHIGYFRGGWIGVDLFFVLSGYLITNLLKNEYTTTGMISFGRFYIRRALRLFPPLILAILLANLLWPYTLHYSQHPDQLVATLASLFYVANCLPGNLLGDLSHMWSLAVEEHFYFIWPIIMAGFLLRVSHRNRVNFFVISLVSIGFFRIYIQNLAHPIQYGLFIIDAYQFTFCRVDTIIAGAGLALFQPVLGRRVPKNQTGFLYLSMIIMLLTVILFTVDMTNLIWRNGGFLLTNLICLVTVGLAARFPDQPLLAHPILRWIGRRSYGIYVYHMPVFMAFDTFMVQHNIVQVILLNLARIAVTIVLAALSFRFVEQPILAWRNGRTPVDSGAKPETSEPRNAYL